MAARDAKPFIDSVGARIVAVLVIAVCVAALAYLHRDALFPPPPGEAAAANPQLAACLAERVGAVEKMRAEGILPPGKYEDFRARAEAFCQAQFSEGGPPQGPGLPAR